MSFSISILHWHSNYADTSVSRAGEREKENDRKKIHAIENDVQIKQQAHTHSALI